MRRFVLKNPPDQAGRVRLEGKDHRYLARVLRLGAGDSFRVLLPSGEEVLMRVVQVAAGELIAERLAPESAAQDGSVDAAAESAALDRFRQGSVPAVPPILLCQALPKGQKMDLVVRQAAEAGIARIIPFISRNTVIRIEDAAEGERKRERWERIIREARQQSGSDVDTVVEAPTDLDGVIHCWEGLRKEKPSAVAIVLHQDPLAQGTLHGYLSHGPAAVLLAVGPEGGFSGAEASRLLSVGFKPLLLGANVLRAETAALFAAAATHVLLLESASWMPSNGSPA